MTPLLLDLDVDVIERIRHRAGREGVEPAALAARLLAEAVRGPDPFDFVSSPESDTVGAGGGRPA